MFDLCSRSLLFILSNICCKATRTIEAKFHVALLWIVRMNVCSNGSGQVTKMAAMPIYGNNELKIFFSKTSRPMRFKLGIQHPRLRIRSVISVNYHYVTVLCPFNLLIRFKCYNTV